jgi:hypothetical protein
VNLKGGWVDFIQDKKTHMHSFVKPFCVDGIHCIAPIIAFEGGSRELIMLQDDDI